MGDMLDTDYTVPSNFLLLTAILFGVIFLRYLVFAGVGHHLLRRFFGHRQLHVLDEISGQRRKETAWSVWTSLTFALSGTGLVILWQRGYTALYTDIGVYGWWYLPVSLIVYLFLHETYYYWLHRWMHRPRVYRYIHKVHHDSTETNAHTSFSFHPLEGLLQAFVIPVLLLIIPLHLYMLLILLLIMTVSGTLNHLGFEMFPAGWARHPVGRWLIGAAHHDQHHKRFRYNFGLYFTFWDRWMGTEDPDFEGYFDQITRTKTDRP